MSSVIPQVAQVAALNAWLAARVLTLRLFSNNITPGVTNTMGSYIEVAGGGYAAIPLVFAEFTVTAGTPSVALYDDFQDFEFTGVTTAPGTIYGYYITDSANNLIQAERFPDADVPFTPGNGSIVRVKPRITAANA